MTDDRVEWVDKDAFVMPALPAALGVDPTTAALLHVAAFLELSGDGAVDPDAAVEALEHVSMYLQSLSPKRIAALRKQVDRVADHARQSDWGEEAAEFFAGFVENCGIDSEDGEADDGEE